MEWSIFNKQQLLQDLTRFGLNPTDWVIKNPLSGHKQPQILSNKKDATFNLLGIPETNRKKARWMDLQILSL